LIDDETHTVTEERVRAFLQSHIDAFVLGIEKHETSV
jgi:hypothetical protein